MMKKLIALVLCLVLVATLFAACGKDEEKTTEKNDGAANTTTEEKTPIADDMMTVAGKIIEISPVEFMGGTIPVDLTDTSEDGLWALANYTGLSSADHLEEVVAYESMIGSQAFSMVLVRVDDAANAKTIAQEMSDNIDTRKWVCVEADEKIVVGYSDVVMLIMLDTGLNLKAQSFVDAFAQVAGGELDFTI